MNPDTHNIETRSNIEICPAGLPLISTESCRVASTAKGHEKNINGFLNSYFDNNSLTLCLPTKEMSARTIMNHEMNGNEIYGRIPLKVN